MRRYKEKVIKILFVFCFGLVPATLSQFIITKPVDKYIHITSFRYGKDPYVIKCNRGDRLHLTFSTKDTGHSFFLEEFDMDVKVNPATEEVAVFKTSDPTSTPVMTKEVLLTASHPGILNYIVSRSNYRCHTWCGPMHAFEQGKLIVFPNTLLIFSLGCMIGILLLWMFRKHRNPVEYTEGKSGYKDLLKGSRWLNWLVKSRWPQLALIILAMLLIYVVILTSVFGTKVSGRNLGVLMMWAVWLFLLVVILTPLGGRLWCTICPLPVLGDYFQRRSFNHPVTGKTKQYNNRYWGYFLKWPTLLSNNWLRLIVFLLLTTFSTTLVGIPRVSGLAVLSLLIVPTFMALVWEHRSFCRYVCPVGVFVGAYSRMSILSIRNKSQKVCDQCKLHYCEKGSDEGWACPYGLNTGTLHENPDCGLCMECTRSCLYKNVTLYKRPFGSEIETHNYGEAWLHIALFTLSIIYSILYLGPWPIVRDYINIMDKQNWGLFGQFALIVWSMVLIIVPAILFGLSAVSSWCSKNRISTREVFLAFSSALLPIGLMLWISFVVPMLFVNKTFVQQSMSDPFGWGWDFFGTANIPWHQFLPEFIPWIQALMVLTGLYYSLESIQKKWRHKFTPPLYFTICSPLLVFLTATTISMLLFFVN